jgi:hypothetical protein
VVSAAGVGKSRGSEESSDESEELHDDDERVLSEKTVAVKKREVARKMQGKMLSESMLRCGLIWNRRT